MKIPRWLSHRLQRESVASVETRVQTATDEARKVARFVDMRAASLRIAADELVRATEQALRGGGNGGNDVQGPV